MRSLGRHGRALRRGTTRGRHVAQDGALQQHEGDCAEDEGDHPGHHQIEDDDSFVRSLEHALPISALELQGGACRQRCQRNQATEYADHSGDRDPEDNQQQVDSSLGRYHTRMPPSTAT